MESVCEPKLNLADLQLENNQRVLRKRKQFSKAHLDRTDVKRLSNTKFNLMQEDEPSSKNNSHVQMTIDDSDYCNPKSGKLKLYLNGDYDFSNSDRKLQF